MNMSSPGEAKGFAQAVRPRRSWAPAFAGMTMWGLALALLAACSGGGTAYERGLAAFEAGDMRTARVEFLNATQADPNDRAARIMQARVMLELGDGVAAETELRRARQAGVAPAELAHLAAHARLLQGDNQGALRAAAGAAPAHRAYAARIAGRAYAAMGDSGNAGAQFNRALEAAPNDGALWLDIARFRRGNGDVAGAIEAADRAVAARPHAEALLLRGQLSRGQYGLAAALPWFDRALEADPADVDALLERAATYGDMGRMRDMLADIRRAHALSGGHVRGYYLQAVLAARARNFPAARSIWNRTNGAYDETPSGMLILSAIDVETGNEEQAARRLAQLVRSQPGNRRARRLLASAQWRMNDPAAVVATLRPIADRPDADAYSLSLIGRALDRLGDEATASLYLARAARPGQAALVSLEPIGEGEFAALRRAAEENPNDGPAQVRLIAALLSRGLGGEALDRARILQAGNQGVPEVHVLVGDALEANGDYLAAAAHYRRAANIAFTEGTALRLIGALQRSGQAAEAENVLRLFVSQNPRSIPGLILLAGREMQAENWDGAIAIYESLRARIGDNDATILNNLALAYAEAGELAEAVPLARRAWTLDRNNPATADTLGWLLFKAGRRAEGLVLLERAARGAPSDAEVRRRLALARRG